MRVIAANNHLCTVNACTFAVVIAIVFHNRDNLVDNVCEFCNNRAVLFRGINASIENVRLRNRSCISRTFNRLVSIVEQRCFVGVIDVTGLAICRCEQESGVLEHNFLTETCLNSCHSIINDVTLPTFHETRSVIFDSTEFSIFKSLLSDDKCTLERSGTVRCRETFSGIKDRTDIVVTRFLKRSIKANARSERLLESINGVSYKKKVNRILLFPSFLLSL